MKKILKSMMMLAVVMTVTISLVACGSKNKGPNVPGWVNSVPTDMAEVGTFLESKGYVVIEDEDMPAGLTIGMNDKGEMVVIADIEGLKALALFEMDEEDLEEFAEDMGIAFEDITAANLISTIKNLWTTEAQAELKAELEAMKMATNYGVSFDSDKVTVTYMSSSVIVMVKGDIVMIFVELSDEAQEIFDALTNERGENGSCYCEEVIGECYCDEEINCGCVA